jgi:peptidoglycan/LPS O-acetylase OafA/YrhL
MTAVNANRSYYPALDGLRGLAILLVVFYHNFGFIRQSFFGWLGVDLFFVLSGFLITGILFRSLGEKNYLRNFYMRRLLRIFPLYYVSLFIFLVIFPMIRNLPADMSYYTSNQAWLWTYFQNWLYIFKPTNSSDILHHLWSLAVEEQFYILWPLVIVLLKKPRTILFFIVSLLVLVISFRLGLWIFKIENLAYYNLYTFSRIDGLCIGSIVAILTHMNFDFIRKHTTWIVLSFALINFAFYFSNRFYDFSFPYIALVGYSTFAMMFGLLVYEAVRGETKIINIIFGFKPLRFFGKISYAFYIFHWPVFILCNGYLLEYAGRFTGKFGAQVSISLLATVVSILISWLSFRYFESHFLKLKNRYT